MGQRHQVYIRLPAIDYGKGNPNNRPTQVIGLHHQWLYGRTAIRLLANFFRALEAYKANHGGTLTYFPLGSASVARDGAEGMMQAIWSTDVAEGYYHNVHLFDGTDGETENPYRGDNNDGITVVDMADPLHPKYCLFTLEGIEAQGNPGPDQILSATDYALAYYPDMKDRKGNDMTAWVAPELAVVTSYPVMTRQELSAVFPKMSARLDA